jgi:hypothetical protein
MLVLICLSAMLLLVGFAVWLHSCLSSSNSHQFNTRIRLINRIAWVRLNGRLVRRIPLA